MNINSEHRKLFKVFLPFALADFIASFFGSVMGLLSLYIIPEFHLSGLSLGATFSSSLLVSILMPLPLGSLIDYYGARKVQATLFTIATIGIAVFATATHPFALFIGRALISVGLSGGLIAGFKSVRPYINPNRIPLFDGIILGLGVAGSIVATVPTEMLLRHFSWREILLGWTVITLLMTLWFILKKTNHSYKDGQAQTLKQQFVQNKIILRSPYFWKIVFLVCFAYGSKIAFLNLWAAVWMKQVVGLSQDAIARYLMACAVALFVGDITWGIIAERISYYWKQSVTRCICAGSIVFLVVQVLLMFQIVNIQHYWLWFLFAFASRYTTLAYSALAQYFDRSLLGSSATAMNTCFYLFAFVTQLSMGIHQAYHITFGIIISLQLLSLIWFVLSTKKFNLVPHQFAKHIL